MTFRNLFLSVFLSSCAVAGVDADGGGQSIDATTTADGRPAIDAGSPDAAYTACSMALEQLVFDFESGEQGFTHDLMAEVDPPPVTWTFDHWEFGTPEGQACAAGSKCWATNLDGNYIQCGRGYLQSPAIDLSDCGDESRDVQILFDQNYDFWTGDWDSSTWYDGGIVEISTDGTTWQALDFTYSGTLAINPQMTGSYSCVEGGNFYVHGKSGFVGSSSGWTTASATIPASLLSQPFQIRWSYSAGVSSQTSSQAGSMDGTRPGWYLDNLRFDDPPAS